MFNYILRRLIMMIPTLFGITLLNFAIINAAPGGPIEQKIQEIRFGGMGQDVGGGADQGISQEVIENLRKRYGFDKPIHIRYFNWLADIATLEFGESFTYEEPVVDVIMDRFPVSLQFGIVSFIMVYLICIPLGILKAVRDGSHFDMASSVVLMVLYSIPPLILGVLMRIFLAGRLDLFPLDSLYSDNYFELTTWEAILDRVHHFILPLIAYMVGSFTVLTFLMKNSLLDEIKSDYVRTARAKGLAENVVIYKHALRNALIPIATGFGSFLGIFFAGSLIIEQIFSIDGMGLLGYRSVLSRDYNVLMGLILFQSILLLFGRLISDLSYLVIDPRIDFS